MVRHPDRSDAQRREEPFRRDEDSAPARRLSASRRRALLVALLSQGEQVGDAA
jgi:hypothetical protein